MHPGIEGEWQCANCTGEHIVAGGGDEHLMRCAHKVHMHATQGGKHLLCPRQNHPLTSCTFG